MWVLAIKAMLADRGKLVTTLLGVTFSVALINMQGALLLGFVQKASMLVDYGGADIWVGHRHMNNVDMGTFIPERWVHRIRSVEGVERAEPYIIAFGQATLADGRFENVIVVGCEPASLLGNAWEMDRGDSRQVLHPDGVLVDVYDAVKMGNCKIGDYLEIGNHRAKVVGMTRGILGFTTTPYVFTTLERARRKFAGPIPADKCCYFLVRARPGTDVASLVERIRTRVPELDVYDRKTFSLMCMLYWLTRTGIGISFGLAAFLGLLVGLAVVAQTLYASVAERVREFGALKAMGAADGCIGRFLIAQAVGSATLGSVLGLFVSVLLGVTMSTPRAPVILTWQVGVLSVVIVVGVCVVAAYAPYWRVRRIDPASVLRS